jgi:ADP-heptose:LPS heptosyltransferase
MRRLGDTVLWSSALQALRDYFPEGEIHLALPASYHSLFSSDPRVDKVIALPAGKLPLVRDIWQLHRQNYDWVLNFHASRKTRAISFWCGAHRKIIHHHSRRGLRYGSSVPVINVGQPMAAHERDLNVVRTLGWRGDAPSTKIFLNPGVRERAAERLKKQGWDFRTPLVLIGMRASRLSKEWRKENYLKLCQRLSPRAQIGIVFDNGFPAENDRLEFRKVAWELPTPTLEDAMGYLSYASVYLGSDSGLKHLACALGVPTVTLFGPESLGEWHFYPSPPHAALQAAVLCRDRDRQDLKFAWCGADICPLGSHACMNLISVENVSLTVRRVLDSARIKKGDF